MARASLNDLRALAAVLPPDRRLAHAETADVLSALIAVAEHGSGLTAAAQQGQQAVYEFFHQAIVDEAAATGKPAPVRGNVQQDVTTVPQASAVDQLAAQVAALTQLVTGVVAKLGGEQAAPQPANSGEAVPPATAEPTDEIVTGDEELY